MIAPETLPAAEILSSAKSACSDILENAEVFDVYVGGQIPKGKKSIAIKLTFRNLNKTLKDEEVNEEINKVLGKLSENEVVLR